MRDLQTRPERPPPCPLGRLFNDAAPTLLDFNKSTRIAFKPEVGVDPDVPFDPRRDDWEMCM